jgi:hypothetical protein
MTKAVWGAGIRLAGVVSLVLTSVSCGDLARQGTASSYLVVAELVAESGADPGKFGATLFSDVYTIKDELPGVWADNGRVSFTVAMKDPGPPSSPTALGANNFITLDGYHVRYIRSDGRNTPGVDVPYPFDGSMTFTVTGERSESFVLVRHNAKEESPLAALRLSPIIIDTHAEITFYGHDQTGRAVSTTAQILIEFGNFGDPK